MAEEAAEKWPINQQFFYDNGYIVSRMNGFVLDVAGGKAEPGAKVITYPRHGKPNQMWDYDKASGQIVSRMGGYVLDIPGGTPDKGEQMIVYNRKDVHKEGQKAANQQWDWDADGRIVSRLNPKFCLDVNGGLKHALEQGRAVCIYPKK